MPISYKGSKRKLAKNIYDLILKENPNANTIVDLFCGGFAVGEEFMLNGWTVYANDINKYIVALIDQVVNKVLDPDITYKFVTREQFTNVRDNPDDYEDWYVGFVLSIYSFGNNCLRYIYGKHIEEYKQKYHDVVVDGIDNTDYLAKYCTEYVKLKNNINIDCKIVMPIGTKIQSRRLEIRKQINIFERMCKQELQILKKVQSLERLQSLQSLQSLESLERLQSLENLKSDLTLTTLDYQDVQIPEQAIIYCDIPYIDTDKYHKQGFNHIKFWDWVRIKSKTHKVYISEYNAPDDFEVVFSFAKTSSYSSHTNKTQTVEKIFTYSQQ